jgi:hypothetical protein
MSDFNESIYAIYNNPFILTPILIAFYKNYVGNKNDVLLSYLVLPIVLEPDHITEIKVINSRTRLSRFTKNREFMSGFYDRLKAYKGMTNFCLQYAIDSNYIRIDEEMQVHVINQDTLFIEPTLSNALRIANTVPKVFKNINVVNIFKAFGIKEL